MIALSQDVGMTGYHYFYSLWVTGSMELLLTLPECADKVASTRPVSLSEILVLLSAELVTSRAPSWQVQ